MPQYYKCSDFDSDEEPKKPKEKKEKLDCKECGNDRSCNYCKLKVKTETEKIKNISLALVRYCKNKWIPCNIKLTNLEKLSALIMELHSEI